MGKGQWPIVVLPLMAEAARIHKESAAHQFWNIQEEMEMGVRQANQCDGPDKGLQDEKFTWWHIQGGQHLELWEGEAVPWSVAATLIGHLVHGTAMYYNFTNGDKEFGPERHIDLSLCTISAESLFTNKMKWNFHNDYVPEMQED